MFLYFLLGVFFGCGITYYRTMKKVNALKDEVATIKMAIEMHNNKTLR